jgi:hypothetical protein
MRRLFVLMALVFAISAVLASASVLADDAKDGKAAQASKDPNFRWHNGQWWYWVPAEKNWLVWNGSQWTPFVAGRAVRSYSYAPSNAAGAQFYTTYPDSVSNQRIIGSYGFRSAGSKPLGNY